MGTEQGCEMQRAWDFQPRQVSWGHREGARSHRPAWVSQGSAQLSKAEPSARLTKLCLPRAGVATGREKSPGGEAWGSLVTVPFTVCFGGRRFH